MRRLILYMTTAATIGCSTLSHKNKTLAYMGGAFATGAVIGATQTSEKENANLHGLLWGSVAAAAVGAVMTYMYDEPSDLKAKDYKIRELETRLSDFQHNTTKSPKDGVSDFMESKLPKEYRGLVQPGKWKLYQIDEWKKSSEGEFVHQDKLLEITPATVTIEQ